MHCGSRQRMAIMVVHGIHYREHMDYNGTFQVFMDKCVKAID